MAQSATNRSKGGRSTIFIGVAILAVCALAYVAYDGFPPSDDQAVGAIGTSDRYRTEQISDQDVQLDNPEIQQLIQNDEFQKLVTDKSFQEMAGRTDFANLMANKSYQGLRG